MGKVHFLKTIVAEAHAATDQCKFRTLLTRLAKVDSLGVGDFIRVQGTGNLDGPERVIQEITYGRDWVCVDECGDEWGLWEVAKI